LGRVWGARAGPRGRARASADIVHVGTDIHKRVRRGAEDDG
jgi:hypothetical protein